MKHSSTKHGYHSLSNPVRVIEHNWGDNTIPLVSVKCVTYNHERYIRDALEGFLIQETDFPFQVCIFDDASTDGNVRIIKEYANNYPNLFKCFFLEENSWGKPNRMEVAKPFLDASNEGKYIALCDGDDYWTDPLKLQKQVQFLETYPNYVLSHSDVDVLYQETGNIIVCHNKGRTKNANTFNRKSVLLEGLLSRNYVVRTPTVLFRRSAFDTLEESHIYRHAISNYNLSDITQWIELSRIGQFHYMPEATAVYRVSMNTASRPDGEEQRAIFAFKSADLFSYYADQYPISLKLRRRLFRAKRIRAINLLSLQDIKHVKALEGCQITQFDLLLFSLLKVGLFARLLRRGFRSNWLMNL